jgi:hypothetical protein
LGSFFGICLFLTSVTATGHWEQIRQHSGAYFLFVAIPLGLALLSPTRLISVGIGLMLPMFRFVFLIIAFRNAWGLLGVLCWLAVLISFAIAINGDEKYMQLGLPEKFRTSELLGSLLSFGGGVAATIVLRHVLALA